MTMMRRRFGAISVRRRCRIAQVWTDGVRRGGANVYAGLQVRRALISFRIFRGSFAQSLFFFSFFVILSLV